MQAKLIRLPMPSAMPSASSQAPLLRVDGQHSMARNTAKYAITAKRPSASSQATRTRFMPATFR